MNEPTSFAPLPTSIDALLTEEQLQEAAEHLCQPWGESIPALLVDEDMTIVFDRSGPLLTVCVDRAEGSYRGLDNVLYGLQFVATGAIDRDQRLMQGSGVTNPHNKDKVSPERLGRIKKAMDKLMGAIDTLLRERGEAKDLPKAPKVPTELPSNVMLFDRQMLMEATRKEMLAKIGKHLLTGDGVSDGESTWVWDRAARVMFLYFHRVGLEPQSPFMSADYSGTEPMLGFSSQAHELLLAQQSLIEAFVTTLQDFLFAAVEAEDRAATAPTEKRVADYMEALDQLSRAHGFVPGGESGVTFLYKYDERSHEHIMQTFELDPDYPKED